MSSYHICKHKSLSQLNIVVILFSYVFSLAQVSYKNFHSYFLMITNNLIIVHQSCLDNCHICFSIPRNILDWRHLSENKKLFRHAANYIINLPFANYWNNCFIKTVVDCTIHREDWMSKPKSHIQLCFLWDNKYYGT